MRHVLCFGDSNTFGTDPLVAGGRHPDEMRWTGILQQQLGADWRVIEEGLGGRTAVYDDPIEPVPTKNGATALPIALHSHRPLDVVIIALGTNDLKSMFHATPRVIAAGIGLLTHMVQTYEYGPQCAVPQVILVSPIHVKPGIADSVFAGFEEDAVERSQQLAYWIRQEAQARGCGFVDASQVAEASDADKLHMELPSHHALGMALAEYITQYYA